MLNQNLCSCVACTETLQAQSLEGAYTSGVAINVLRNKTRRKLNVKLYLRFRAPVMESGARCAAGPN